MISIRRKLMAQATAPSPGVLPSAYQEVEYIQGRVTYDPSYIDTLYIPTVNTKLRVKFTPNDANQYGYFGAREDPYRFYCATFYTRTQLSCGLTVDSWPSTRVALLAGSSYDCYIANGQSEINGTVITTPIISAGDWSDSIGSICLKSRSADSRFDPDSTAKFYICQIWENNVLVRDFVPCYRKSDNEVGMYDTVGMRFYTNAGVGSLIAGPDVN